jgi:hypothetical protein
MMSEDLTAATVDIFTKPEMEKPDVQIDTPINLRPDLAMYGIEEVDRGICEDTFENRQALRRAKLNWIPVYAINGVPTGTIQALSPEMQSQQRLNSLAEKEAILTDVNSKNSDYLTGFDLLAEEAADNIVPPWVLGATKVWAKWTNGSELERGKRKEPFIPKRCSAIKDDGIRCQLWTGGRPQDDGMCRVHLGSLRNKPTDSVERARHRLTQAAPAAVDVLEFLIENGESEPVKLKAATEILDRAGVRAGFDFNTDITVDVRPAAAIIAERLARLSKGAENIIAINAAALADQDIIDAEVVEPHTETQEESDKK